MKKRVFMPIVAVFAACALIGCEFLMGPDEPVGGNGNLVISFGERSGRAITSAEDLREHGDVFEALLYKVTLTGPGEKIPEQTVAHGGTLELTLALGVWRLDVRAYKDDGLAGTASFPITVVPGLNALEVPMALNEGYFDITLDSMENGTVQSDPKSAFPEAAITLTVMPDEGYALKAESLKVVNKGDNKTVPLSESGSNYTFAMPASDVIISAVFNRLIGIVIEGPEDETVEVLVEHSKTGAVPGGSPLEISWIADETLAFTLDSDEYSAEDDTLRWLMNGDKQAAGGKSLTIKARDHLVRTYTLTVMIKKNDQWYSTDINFTVARGE
jgi:hypothetical protein